MFNNNRDIQQENISKFRFRWIIYLLTGFTLFTTTAVSSSLSLTIVAMMKNGTHNSSTSDLDSQTVLHVDWNNVEKDRMLQAISWGSLAMAIIGGRIAETVGPRIVNFVSLISIGILNCIYPTVALKSYIGAYAIRVAQGFSIGIIGPANYVILSYWAPFFEKTASNAIVNSLCFAANAVINPVVGVLVTSSFLEGWPSVFYIFGGVNIALAFIWLIVARNKPEDHSWLTPYEINEITLARSKGQSFSSKLPWLSMLSSISVLAYLFTGFTHGWLIAFVTTQVPSFYKDVFKVSLKQNGFISSLPWILNIIVILFAGFSVDKLRQMERFNLTRLRKGYTLVGIGISSLTFLGVTFIGDNTTVAVALITLTKGIGGLNIAGAGSNQLDLSPSFTGTLSGLQATVSSISQLAMNEAVVWIVGNTESQTNWYLFFYITAGISLLGAIIYCLFGSAEIQKFDPCSLHLLVPRYSQDSSDQSYEITNEYFVESFS